jgi:hypothetical protein
MLRYFIFSFDFLLIQYIYSILPWVIWVGALGILQAWCLLVPFTFDNTDCNHPYGYFMVTCMIVKLW